MNSLLQIPLNASPEQVGRLEALQRMFARLCNALAPTVQQTRCWNRVTLHHLTYKALRAQFPEVGSQMVCNAIYSVSRTGRLVFQHANSPFNLTRLGAKPLPLLRFTDSCPVYFDRHTLSLKGGQLSMYTLDGRMRFQLALDSRQEEAFHTQKLREIVLSRRKDGGYQLAFLLVDEAAAAAAKGSRAISGAQDESEMAASADVAAAAGEIPEYVLVEDADA